MNQKFVSEGRGVWESQFFGVEGDIEEHDGDVVDEPTVGAVVEIKKGERAICINEEVVLMGVLMDKPVGGGVFGQGVDVLSRERYC